MLEQQLLDIRDRLFRLVHRKRRLSTEEIDKLKTDYARYFEQLERWLGLDDKRLWLTGPRLSYVDFLAGEYLSWFRDFVQADCFDDDRFPRLKAYMERYFSLPQLKEYHNAPQYKDAHRLSPYAILGYRGGANLDPETGENLFWNKR